LVIGGTCVLDEAGWVVNAEDIAKKLTFITFLHPVGEEEAVIVGKERTPPATKELAHRANTKDTFSETSSSGRAESRLMVPRVGNILEITLDVKNDAHIVC